MVLGTLSFQDACTHRIWDSYLKGYRRYALGTKRDGGTDSAITMPPPQKKKKKKNEINKIKKVPCGSRFISIFTKRPRPAAMMRSKVPSIKKKLLRMPVIRQC